MKKLLLFVSLCVALASAHAAPLRVFIRAGQSNRGRDAHAHPRFMEEWKPLLAARGMQVDGALDWPTEGQFGQTDVLVMYAQDGGNATPEQQKNLGDFIKRGGGLVVLHTAAVSNDPPWWKSVIGGAWVPGKTKWKEGPMDLYFTENQFIGGGHPITKGAANFHFDDEIYYDMDISPDVRVLATSYTPNVPAGKRPPEGGKVSIYDIQPQMWTYEKDNYRAFVSIPGHLFKTFELPNYRAIVLRGIAWAGKRPNLDEFCQKEEIASLTYPPGGPQRPADTLKALEIHPDFTLKLVASEPLINKPMNFDWAPDGSLWVAETPEYPNGRRGMRPDYRGKEWKDHGGIDPDAGSQERKALDKISRLTDTDGDGVMDKKEVFYEGLDLVTGLVFYKDGVIVTQAPDILWLRDTNGDGKADKVEKLYGNLGINDTHAVINNPRWGWDGWIYATHGYSASSKVVNAKGELMPTIGSGVVRFRPDGTAIEQYSSKGGNTWGLEITGDNRVMWTQPTSGTILQQTVLPEYALARGKIGNTPSFKTVIGSPKSWPLMPWEQLAYVQIDLVGSFTATAGCVIYDGGAWPPEYNGDYLTTEPTINIIHHERLTAEKSSYTGAKLPGREQTEFVRSRDMWWRPIEVRVGPDGAVYVGDFYNQAVIHNDTRGPDHNRVNAAVRPDRDHYFGRIWRLDHKDAKKIAVPDLSKAGPAELVKALAHPNRAVRLTANRLIWERGEEERLAPGAGKEAQQAWELKKLVEQREFMAKGAEALFKEKMMSQQAVLEKQKELEQAKTQLREAEAALQAKGLPSKPTPFAEAISPAVAAMWDGANAETRIAGLWACSAAGMIDANVTTKALADKDPAVRRNLLLIEDSDHFFGYDRRKVELVNDPDASVRVAALRAIARDGGTEFHARMIVSAWPKFDDDYQRSAAVGAASRNPAAVIAAALESADASALAPLVSAVSQGIASGEAAAKLVVVLSDKPAGADALKRSILGALFKNVKDTPKMTPELAKAFGALLSGGAAQSALPLVAKWDTGGEMKGRIGELLGQIVSKLDDTKTAEEDRINAARAILGLRGAVNRELVPLVTKHLTTDGSSPLKRGLVAALGETDDTSVGTALSAAFGKLPADVQPAAFDVLLKRTDWANAFLDAVKAKAIDGALLGPSAASRLRTHPNKDVAKRAADMLDELNPMAKMRKEMIAKLASIVEQKGDPAAGKMLFTTLCAVCHKFGDTGADIGPVLTGMGAHGASELLTAIADPNNEVDPSFVQWNIEAKDGQTFAGVIASENPTTITLKSLAGVQQVKVADIKSRVNTGLSLMPDAFFGLPGEQVRDIIAFMQSTDGGKFRTLDLREAFTANTSRGLYVSQDSKNDTFQFLKTGTVNVGGIPFNIVSPEKAATGKNIIVLKGGQEGGYSKSLPQRVEVKAGGFKANRVHFLGGVTGWGFNNNNERGEVMKVTIHTTQGQREGLVFKNGVEFADYIRPIDVPGSKLAEGVVRDKQLRYFSKQLELGAVEIERITLESLDTGAAPTTVAITLELADPNSPISGATSAPAASGNAATSAPGEDENFKPQFSDAVPQPPASAKGPRVLIVGGGSSHDFVKFFGGTDKATLAPVVGWVDFTQNLNGIAPILDKVDVLVLSANQPISSATKKALIDYANRGGAIIAHHPGTWYAWNNFPQWNKEIVGGGTRGHDNLGPFPVKVTNATHPITKDVPAEFEVTDELYNYVADPVATPIEVLVTATSPKTGKTFPQVFVVKHPKAKIVGITLGHDARAHDLPAYQALLKNAVLWAGAR